MGRLQSTFVGAACICVWPHDADCLIGVYFPKHRVVSILSMSTGFTYQLFFNKALFCTKKNQLYHNLCHEILQAHCITSVLYNMNYISLYKHRLCEINLTKYNGRD